MKPLLIAIVLLASPLSFADDANLIATACKKQWRGDKAMQSYCIKNQRNYESWLGYIQKRVFADKASLAKAKACSQKYRPDYQKAFSCYWND